MTFRVELSSGDFHEVEADDPDEAAELVECDFAGLGDSAISVVCLDECPECGRTRQEHSPSDVRACSLAASL